MRLMIAAMLCFFLTGGSCFADDVKLPNVAGGFYPAGPEELQKMVDALIEAAHPKKMNGPVLAIIAPHAGYGFSGFVAAQAYKLIKGMPYKTVVVIGPSHYYPFNGVSVYPKGAFRTPLGDLEIDSDFAAKLLNTDPDISFEPAAFEKEHSVEVQLPFLQRSLSDFKIVPIVMGDCTLDVCSKLAGLLKDAIGKRQDVLVVASSDMYHGYDYDEADIVDGLTLSYLKKMDDKGLYYGLRESKLQLCGGFPVVSTLMLAKSLGHEKLEVLDHTNSAIVTGKKIKGVWTVGYCSCGVDQEKGGGMLSKEQRKKLLKIARDTIDAYLKTGKKPELSEQDPALTQLMGAFVTLSESGKLRGCIGSMVGREPLYLTIRDMAVEAAVGDPRFHPVKETELKDLMIEISVLSPLEKVDSADKIEMGKHGVLISRGFSSGVFLPQVATETGWSKEEFLSELCSQKAGLPPDAWKDKSTNIYVFTAEVFSEKYY